MDKLNRALTSPVLMILFVISLNPSIVLAKNKWIFTGETLKVLPDGSREKLDLSTIGDQLVVRIIIVFFKHFLLVIT